MSITIPTVSWEAVVSESATYTGDYNYTCKLSKNNPNDPGYGDLVVGYYVVDFVGHLFEITGINFGADSEAVILHDLLESDTESGPYNLRESYVYSSLHQAATVAQAKLNRLDESAEDFVRNLGVDPAFVNAVQFNKDYVHAPAEWTEGLVHWNSDDHTLDLHTGYGSTLQVGQEIHIKVYNDSGETIDDGTAVYPTGAFNDYPTIGKARTDTHETVAVDYGMTTTPMDDGEYGFVTWFGKVRGIDTSMWNVGDRLWISPTNPGEMVNVHPVFPNYVIQIGIVFIKDALDGQIFVTSRDTVKDTVQNFWNGVFRESFDFRIASNGTIITGSLEPDNGHDDMTMMFSDGFTLLDTSPAATITLTAGTATIPQVNFIYIPQSTKVLTVSTSDWPTTTEHIKVAQVLLRTAALTQEEGALRNQNWNDHLQCTTTNQGHLSHMGERMRQNDSKWESGVEGSVVIDAGAVYVKNTSGVVYQMHRQTFPLLDMTQYTIDAVSQGSKTFTISGDGDLTSAFPDSRLIKVNDSTGNDTIYTIVSTNYADPDFVITVEESIASAVVDGTIGDVIHIVNHDTTPYTSLTDLASVVNDASGNVLNNTSYSIVVWGVQNKTGEESQLMANLPTNTYSKNFPQQSVDDAFNYSVYDIPKPFQGVGFLIARFTFINTGGVWSLHDTEDLRGKTPNTTAGGGAGGAGVTSFLGLGDTPSAYTAQGEKLIQVNAAETALEFITDIKTDSINEWTTDTGVTVEGILFENDTITQTLTGGITDGTDREDHLVEGTITLTEDITTATVLSSYNLGLTIDGAFAGTQLSVYPFRRVVNSYVDTKTILGDIMTVNNYADNSTQLQASNSSVRNWVSGKDLTLGIQRAATYSNIIINGSDGIANISNFYIANFTGTVSSGTGGTTNITDYIGVDILNSQDADVTNNVTNVKALNISGTLVGSTTHYGIYEDFGANFFTSSITTADIIYVDTINEYTTDAGINIETVHFEDGGITLGTGATVDTIETTLTDDDTHIPTSGAVFDALALKEDNITPAALTKTNDTNVTLTLGGTPATALLQATSLTLGWTGTLADGRIASASTWNALVSNVTTDLSLGTVTSTTMDVNSSDGTDATLISATTTDAGLLTAAKWDEIVANTAAQHAEVHTLLSHTISGETLGHVLVADSATTYSIRQLLGSEINNDSGWTSFTWDYDWGDLINTPTTTSGYGITDAVLLTGNQTVNGIKTFGSFGITPSSAPTTDYQWANKKYVDDNDFNSPLTTKGDIHIYSTVDDRLSVGTNRQILTANDEETSGLKWVDEVIKSEKIKKNVPVGNNVTSLWLVSPKAVYYNGNTYIVYNDYDDNDRKIAKYNHATDTCTTNTWTQTAFDTGSNSTGRDYAHAAPTIFIDSNGYINLSYTGYKNGNIYNIRSTNAEDITTWDSEVTVLSDSNTTAYPTIVEVNNTYVIFYRKFSTNYKLARKISSDNGSTWTNEVIITDYFPYYQVRVDSNERVHIAWHSNPVSTNINLYYIYTDDAEAATPIWKTVDGSTVTIPLSVSSAKIFDSTINWDTCYILGLVPDNAGKIHIFAEVTDSVNDDEILYFEYSGSSWNETTIVTGTFQTWSTAGRIFGDVTFVNDNIYLTIPYIYDTSFGTYGKSELQEWVSYDKGSSWKFNEYITVNSPDTTANPFYARNSKNILWFEGDDDYGIGKELYIGIDSHGDMFKNVYDPLNIHSNVFDMSNMAEGSVNKILTNATQSIFGVKTFNVFPITPSSAPTTDYQVANKKYVDDNGGAGYWTQTPVTFELYYTAGNVGIGTTTPQESLHVYGTGATVRAEIEAGDGSVALLKLTNTEGSFSLSTNSDTCYIYDNTDSAYRFLIDGDGNVGIGIASPSSLLHLVATSPKLILRADSANDSIIDLLETGDSFGVSGTNGARLTYDGGANKFFIKTGVSTTVTDVLTIDIVTNNVGIGTIGPGAKLEVKQASDVSAQGIHVRDSSAASTGRIWMDGGNFVIQRGATDNANHIILNTTGLGIGTASSSYKLDVNGTGRFNGALTISNGNLYLPTTRFSDSVSASYLNIRPQNNRIIVYDAVNNMTFDVYNAGSRNIHLVGSGDSWINSGNVGIGDSTPSYKLDVNGTGRFVSTLNVDSDNAQTAIVTNGGITADTYFVSSDSAVVLGTNSSGTIYLRPVSSTATTNQTTIASDGDMVVSGTVTATNFILSSDIRLKENIETIQSSTIDDIELKQFNFISDKDKRLRYGVIAQDLEKIHPEMVYESEEGFKQVGYTDFLLAKINSLEIRLKRLEEK